MAKKKQDTEAAEPGVLTTTADLLADGANPRKISDEAAAGLRSSIKRFGNLAGIVFNKRTGELVAGHQRIKQIRELYGDLPIELVDASTGRYGIRVNETEFFEVRVVDWTQEKQRLANVAANSPAISGKFTADLSLYLLSVEAEADKQMPGAMTDLLLVQLMSAGIDTTEAAADPDSETVEFEASSDQSTGDATLRFQVIVECDSEDNQVELLERFAAEGLKCRALIS